MFIVFYFLVQLHTFLISTDQIISESASFAHLPVNVHRMDVF